MFYARYVTLTVRNSTNKSTCSNGHDNSVAKSSLKLTWTGDYLSLKSFVCNTMKLQGDWTQPGGDKKVFTGKSFRITWRKGKKLLNFEGIDSNKIKRAFCIELCDIHEFKQDIQRVNPVATCIDICSTTCKCGELSVDLEGVKLEQVISQNDIKVNGHNVGMLNDVVSNLKKEVYAMREKLDKHVDSQVLYSSKVVDCSTQTTETPDYNDHNNKGQMLSEFEYIKNCKTVSHIQSFVCDNKSIKPKEFTHQTNRVTLDASINSSPRNADDNSISNLKGFSQPCNFDGISSNPSQSDMSGNHESTQNNKPIPTRVTCRSVNRSKKWHEKTNRDCAFNKYWTVNNICSPQQEQRSVSSNGKLAKRNKKADFCTHHKRNRIRDKLIWFNYYY